MDDNKAGDIAVRVGKEMITHGDKSDNYTAPREITVTITLNEYRKLVHDNALHRQAMDERDERHEQLNKIIEEKCRRIQELEAYVEKLSAVIKGVDEEGGEE